MSILVRKTESISRQLGRLEKITQLSSLQHVGTTRGKQPSQHTCCWISTSVLADTVLKPTWSNERQETTTWYPWWTSGRKASKWWCKGETQMPREKSRALRQCSNQTYPEQGGSTRGARSKTGPGRGVVGMAAGVQHGICTN